MHDPKIMEQRAKVTLAADEALMDPAAPRGAIVEVTLADGERSTFPPSIRPAQKKTRSAPRP